jgi:hypothetical protein
MATTQIAPTDIRRLEARFDFDDEPAVLRLLGEHPGLIPLLLEAREQVSVYFPGSTALLRVLADPLPDDDNNELLVLYIQTTLAPPEALARLRQFDEDWWLDAVPRAERKLGTALEYIDEL